MRHLRGSQVSFHVGPQMKMTLLSNFVNSNFGGSICAEDAEQLAVTVFCSLDYLPESFRDVIWDRTRIADEFASLAQEGYLAAATTAHESPDYWSSTIDRFMSGGIKIDYSFLACL